jgi:hypothetical protein
MNLHLENFDYHITYYLVLSDAAVSNLGYGPVVLYRGENEEPVICPDFVYSLLLRKPTYIKLNLSSKPKRGYRKARYSRFSVCSVGNARYLLYTHLAVTVLDYLPEVFYFQIEEWK